MCFYCKEERHQNIQDFVFKSIEELSHHWSSCHSDKGSFRFYPVELLQCNIKNCRYFSTFQGLQRHHQKKHPKDLFVPVTNGRCGLCLYGSDDIGNHKCNQIQNGLQMKLFNPILLTEEVVAGLQELNGLKHIQCGNCEKSFENRTDMMQHHHQHHKYEIFLQNPGNNHF